MRSRGSIRHNGSEPEGPDWAVPGAGQAVRIRDAPSEATAGTTASSKRYIDGPTLGTVLAFNS